MDITITLTPDEDLFLRKILSIAIVTTIEEEQHKQSILDKMFQGLKKNISNAIKRGISQ